MARLTGYTPIQVSRIRRRFVEEGLAGLTERPRSGRPPRLTEAKTARIVALTLKAPPKGLTHWSTREIGERVGVSHATVHRAWQAHALQPHRVETFKFTTDPQAEAKIRDVVRLYLNPRAIGVMSYRFEVRVAGRIDTKQLRDPLCTTSATATTAHCYFFAGSTIPRAESSASSYSLHDVAADRAGHIPTAVAPGRVGSIPALRP